MDKKHRRGRGRRALVLFVVAVVFFLVGYYVNEFVVVRMISVEVDNCEAQGKVYRLYDPANTDWLVVAECFGELPEVDVHISVG